MKIATFLRKKFKRDCETVCVMLNVLGIVLAPVVSALRLMYTHVNSYENSMQKHRINKSQL